MTPGLDEDKLFMVGRGQIQRRHDPFHYLPRFIRLEARVAARSSAKLRDFIRALSSGATPKAEEQEKYYAHHETGVPFVRVQNLSVNGQLQLDGVKYVNHKTHHGLLARSQVKEDALLVKITGVGRMAIASVPAPGFNGNVNQHIACIQTDNRYTSEVLAAWLNTDIAETLAKRRSTGGTRPALDYGALRSIPVIFNEKVLVAVKAAYRQYNQALKQASTKLASIDDYVLAELGIFLPTEPANTIANRIFRNNRRELSGWRFDPLFHSFKLWHAIDEANVPNHKLGLCCHYFKTGFAAGGHMQLFHDDGVIQLRPTNIDSDRELVFDRNVYLNKALLLEKPKDIVQHGEVLFNNTNSQELVGKTVYMSLKEPSFFCSNHMTRISTINTLLNPEYLTAVLNVYQRLKVFFSLCTNWNNQSGVNIDLLRQLPIPTPKIARQEAIAAYVGGIRQEAKNLRKQAAIELEAAKLSIETMLLEEA